MTTTKIEKLKQHVATCQKHNLRSLTTDTDLIAELLDRADALEGEIRDGLMEQVDDEMERADKGEAEIARQQETIDDLTQQLDAMSRKAIAAGKKVHEMAMHETDAGRYAVKLDEVRATLDDPEETQ